MYGSFICSKDFISLLCFYISDMETYYNLCLTNKLYYRTIHKHKYKILSRFCDTLYIKELYPVNYLTSKLLIHDILALASIRILFIAGELVRFGRRYQSEYTIEKYKATNSCYTLHITANGSIDTITFTYYNNQWYVIFINGNNCNKYGFLLDNNRYKIYEHQIYNVFHKSEKPIKALPKRFKIFEAI